MSNVNVAAYCSGSFGPGQIENHIADVQSSGFTTIILWAMHIGRPQISGQQYGDLVFNDGDIRIVSAGVFNPGNDPDIANWPADVLKLKQNGSKVTKIFISVGGGDTVEDFTTVQYMLNHCMTDTLQQNFQALRDAFTIDGQCVIDGIDFDNEELVTADTITQFAGILFDMGFEITFCPYDNPAIWQGYMQTLWNQGRRVSWWNLQCYSGGSTNLLKIQTWIDALSAVVGKGQGASCLVAGLAVKGAEDSYPQDCPQDMCASLSGVSDKGLAGGFIWKYDDVFTNTQSCGSSSSLPVSTDYVNAIQNGLNGNCS